MPFALLKIYHACRLKELVAGTLDGKDTAHVLILNFMMFCMIAAFKQLQVDF